MNPEINGIIAGSIIVAIWAVTGLCIITARICHVITNLKRESDTLDDAGDFGAPEGAYVPHNDGCNAA